MFTGGVLELEKGKLISKFSRETKSSASSAQRLLWHLNKHRSIFMFSPYLQLPKERENLYNYFFSY